MIKTITILILAACLAGCTTVGNTATTIDPDGTQRILKQKVSVPPYGKVADGLLDFRAESVGADGSNWNVESGTAAKDVVNEPKIEMLRLMQLILAMP